MLTLTMVAMFHGFNAARLGKVVVGVSVTGPLNRSFRAPQVHQNVHNVVMLLAVRRDHSSSSTRHHQHAEDTSTDTPERDGIPSYQKIYRLQGATTCQNKSGVTVTSDTGHTLTTDLPKAMGGQNSAPQPVETLLAALMGCTQATALFVGRHMQPTRLILDRLEFDISAVRDERGAIGLPLVKDYDDDDDDDIPSRLQSVSGTVTVYAVKNQNIDPEAIEKLKELTEKRCPVANMMIASGCRMDVVWVDGNA